MRWFTTVLWVAILLVGACDRGASVITEPPPAPTPFVWSPGARCADCHDTEVNSMAAPTLLAAKHAATGNSCLDCHDTAGLKAAHQNVEAARAGVPVRKYSRDLCFKCHGSYAAIIELTKGRTRLNPHDSHYGEVDCFICHQVHSAKSPHEFCVSCHITMN